MQKLPASMLFILITLVIDTLGIGLVIPVLPKLVITLARSEVSGATYYGIFVAVFATMQFICSPLLGVLSDFYGRRPVILISLLGTAIDYFLMALAPSLWLLGVARVISGATSANIAAANAYIADISSPEDRAKNYGLVGAAFGVGFILGPAIGGLLGQYDVHWPFYFAGILALLNTMYGYFVLPESLKPENRNPIRWSKANPFGAFGILKRYPIVQSLSVSMVLNSIAVMILQTVWVLYTTHRFGWDSLHNGLALTLYGIMTALVQGILVGILVPKIGERRAILWGVVISACEFIALGIAWQGWMLFMVMIFGSLGGIGGPATQGLISRHVDDNEQGAVQGALSSLGSLTAVVAPILGTSIFAWSTSGQGFIQQPGLAFWVAAFLILCSYPVIVSVLHRYPEQKA